MARTSVIVFAAMAGFAVTLHADTHTELYYCQQYGDRRAWRRGRREHVKHQELYDLSNLEEFNLGSVPNQGLAQVKPAFLIHLQRRGERT